MRKFYKALATGGLVATSLSGCADFQIEISPYERSNLVSEFEKSPSYQSIYPGQSVLLKPHTDRDSTKQFVARIALTDSQEPAGFTDQDAPTVGSDLIRVDTHIEIDGKSSDLKNDLACDTLNVDLEAFQSQTTAKIGALALSEEEKDQVLINWPLSDDGSPGEALYMCFNDGNEPADGVILYTDQPDK